MSEVSNTELSAAAVPIRSTPALWFCRGFVVGVLLIGAVNALSYFWRSEGGGNLTGGHPGRAEALGFPWLVWEKGNAYGGWFVDYRAMLLNAAFASAVGVVFGKLAVRKRRLWERLLVSLEDSITGRHGKVQVSIGGLLMATIASAILAAAGRYLVAGRPEALGIIFLMGPWILVVIALIPRNIPWQTRVVILIPITLLMIGGAVYTGASLQNRLEFDEVLMGIFVCWTPQCAFAAMLLTAAIIFRFVRQQ